ncbi:MAG: hypothetical protein P8Y28_10560 [Gammaproteobacteria bacterium]
MSSNDVFGTDNFDDLVDAVNSLEDFSDDVTPPTLQAEFTEEPTDSDPFISEVSFAESAESVAIPDSEPGLSEHNLFSTADDEALDDEFKNEFDGIEAASEIYSVLHDGQEALPNNSTEMPVPEHAAASIEESSKAVFSAREVSNIIVKPNTSESAEAALPSAEFLENPSWQPKKRNFSLYSFSQRFPILYQATTACMAIIGFAYLLMFPALFAFVTWNGVEMLNSPFTSNTVLLILAFFSISLFLYLISYKLFDLKFVLPEGIAPDENNAKRLLQKLDDIKQEHRIANIHQIVFTRRHELNVLKVPRFGLPIWSKNVLAIGYPLLQTMTPEHFDRALTRRLLQYSKGRNIVVNWLSFMRRTWTLYATSLKERKGVSDLIHYCFFAPYASFYRNFAVYASQKDELIADEKALIVCNDRDLLKGAQTIRITQSMLVQYFWPKLNEAIKDNTSAPAHIRPYHNLPSTLATLLNSENIDSWFMRLSQEDKNEGNPEAPFAKRMEAMGHSKASVPSAFDVSAANHYFGDQYDELTDEMDALWTSVVQKALLLENLESEETDMLLPFRLSIEAA